MARKPNQRALGENMPRLVSDLQTWLKASLFTTHEREEVRFSRVVCSHLVKGNKRGEEAFYIDVPAKADDGWCEVNALDIHAKLNAEAAVLSGLQRWALYAYLSDDNENHVSRFLVKIDGGGDDEDGDDLASEAPTATGLTSQAMRHAEAFAKINVSGQMTIVSAYQQLVGSQGRTIEKLMDGRLEMLDLIQSTVMQTQAHEIEMVKAQAKAKAIADLGGRLGMFIPALVNKMAGQNLFPVQANAVMMMVKGLVTRLASDKDRLTQILAMLGPDEQTVFFQLLDEVTKPDPNESNGVSEGDKTPS